MRQARLKAPPDHPVAYYHCISRVVNRAFMLGDAEKEHFVRLMRRYEEFCGVRIVTFCVLSNHFHLLVEVPKRPEPDQLPTDEELLRRVAVINGKGSAEELRQLLDLMRSGGEHEAAETLRASYFKRMWDVSFFMKALKQRFTQWFNARNERKGTLWEERFKSVLVEGAGDSLATIAAYIDLNPVRAGIVTDPKDYRWCGYAQTVAGDRRARLGLAIVAEYLRNTPIPLTRTDLILSEYRLLLYLRGEAQGISEENPKVPLKRGFSREAIAEVLASKGKIARAELVRCRVRYFVDGCVIGSKTYVDAIFHENRSHFGPNRQNGARLMRSASPPLYSMRDLQSQVIT